MDNDKDITLKHIDACDPKKCEQSMRLPHQGENYKCIFDLDPKRDNLSITIKC